MLFLFLKRFFGGFFSPRKPPADLGPHYKRNRRIWVRAPGH